MDQLRIGSLHFTGRVMNSASPWASSLEDLSALYKSLSTGGVTTRTATMYGFAEDANLHRVAFTEHETVNSFGYSPHPLQQYLEWVKDLVSASGPSTRPFIISITSSDPVELGEMVSAIQALRKTLGEGRDVTYSRIGIELNTSCPNIPYAPPPAYDPPKLKPLLRVLAAAAKADHTLTIGLKLPPYVFAAQFDAILDAIAELDDPDSGGTRNPIAFLTCTNTLGGCLVAGKQAGEETEWALNGYGGMGGRSLHALSLGNVHRFAQALSAHPSSAMRNIDIIGVGGVCDVDGVRRMLQAGAKVVAVATALGREGVGVFERLKLNMD